MTTLRAALPISCLKNRLTGAISKRKQRMSVSFTATNASKRRCLKIPCFFTRGVGEGTDIVEKEMYTFDDRGSNSITLKPEGTASVCRAYRSTVFRICRNRSNSIIFPRFSATSGRRQAGSANTISSAAKPSAKRTRFWTRKLSIWPGNF